MSDLDVGEEKVAQIAALIEDKLYDAHKDITPKYKMKYRSLLFNLKDTKNQVMEGQTFSGIDVFLC